MAVSLSVTVVNVSAYKAGATPQDIIDIGSEVWTNAEGSAAVDSKAAILARIERDTQTP